MTDDSDWIREVPGNPEYFVTSFGQVWTTRRRVPVPREGSRVVITDTLRRLSESLRNGYISVRLNRRTYNINTLVLEAFTGPRPAGMETRHLDGNRKNNDIKNLRWGTPKENQADRIPHGTALRDEKGRYRKS